MSFLLRFCIGLMALIPSLAYAATLEIPGDGAKVSGIGVISGWKCVANGDITISLNGGDPFPAMYGLPRSDTSTVCGGDDGNNGFFSYTNWGNLGDGEHLVVVYDNGVEFGRSTFTVTTPGTGFLRGASKRVTVDDFPNPGDTTVLEWNQGTQHFEIVDFMGSGPFECMGGLTLHPGEMCMGSVNLAGQGIIDFTFTVEADGGGCIEVAIAEIPCFDTAEEFENLLSAFGVSGVDVTKNAAGSWTINSFPSDF